MRSCAIWLAAFLESFGLLIALRNLTDGVELSMRVAIFPLLVCLHLVAQSFFSLSLYSLFIADGLLQRGFLRYRGRRLTCDEISLAAFLASSSAFSFPSIPTCPAVKPAPGSLRLYWGKSWEPAH